MNTINVENLLRNEKVTLISKIWTEMLWLVAATMITVSLFLLMAFLITPQGEELQEPSDEGTIDITRPERKEQSNNKDYKIREKPEKKDAPLPPVIPKTRPYHLMDSDTSLVIPRVETGKNSLDVSLDRHATPIVRIPPQYPQTALARGIEGWVLVEFTITRTGTVADERVVDAEPGVIFNRETLRAIRRWKYQPKTENGKPIPQYNMREIFHFRIETPE